MGSDLGQLSAAEEDCGDIMAWRLKITHRVGLFFQSHHSPIQHFEIAHVQVISKQRVHVCILNRTLSLYSTSL